MLLQVTHRLSQHVTLLNVQVIKEETPALFNNIAHTPLMTSSRPTVTSSSSPHSYRPATKLNATGFKNEIAYSMFENQFNIIKK